MVLRNAVVNYRKRKFHYDFILFFFTLFHVVEFLEVFTVIINFCRNSTTLAVLQVDGGNESNVKLFEINIFQTYRCTVIVVACYLRYSKRFQASGWKKRR